MKVSSNGLLFIAKEEGCRLKPYLDIAGIPTIGVGNTFYEDGQKVTMNDQPITKERAIALFKLVLARFEIDMTMFTAGKLNQNQFDACCSFSYNVGSAAFKSSTLRRKILVDPNDPTIRDAFLMWNKVKNKKTGKLERSEAIEGRRKREADLYFS